MRKKKDVGAKEQPAGHAHSYPELLWRLVQGNDPSSKPPALGHVPKYQSSLHALVIGINKYKAQVDLRGAVADADAVQDYLLHELNVPASQIINLRDSAATRKAILEAWLSMRNDATIKEGDPVLIYYAGHGASAEAPPDWKDKAGGDSAKVQLLVPHDYDGEKVHPIADRTIGYMLDELARVKGDNITVIFDRCHAASGTRVAHEYDPTLLVRSMEIDEEKHPLPPDLDEDIWNAEGETDNRAIALAKGYERTALRSHMLLAACGADEYAKEQKGRGWFTKALLDVLYTVGADRLTYADLIQRMPELPGQHPQCEGAHRERILFNARAPSQNRLLYPVRIITMRNETSYSMLAGAALGVTAQSQFSIFKSTEDTIHPLRSIGTLTAGEPQAFETSLQGTLSKHAPGDRVWAVQTRAGREEDLKVHVDLDERLVPVLEKIAEEMQSQTREKRRILLVDEKDNADLAIALDERGKAVFDVPRGLNVRYGHTLPPTSVVTTDVEDIYRVIRAAAHFYWHLNRSPYKHTLANKVEVEVYKLQSEAENYDGMELPVTTPVEPIENLNKHDTVEIPIRNGDSAMYGFKIVNRTNIPLYVAAFYFDNSDFSIVSYYQPPIGPSQNVDPPLPALGSLAVGYGTGGSVPYEYVLREGQDLDVGFLKMFITTQPIDLTDISQPSPFEDTDSARAARPVSVKYPAMWDTVLITVVQRRVDELGTNSV